MIKNGAASYRFKTLPNGRCIVDTIRDVTDQRWRETTLAVLEDRGWPEEQVTPSQLASDMGITYMLAWRRIKTLTDEQRR